MDLLSYREIANNFSAAVQSSVGPGLITKILKHYNIIIDKETQHKRNIRKVEKTAQTLQETFGVSNVFQLSEIKEKARNTKIEKYGNAHYVNPNKAKETSLKKYGVENYSSLTECREKVRQTCLTRFGTATPAQNADIMQKMKDTCMQKFGTDNYWKSVEFKKIQQQQYFENYPNLSEEYKEVYRDAGKLRELISTLADKTTYGIANYFGISRASAEALLLKHNLLDLREISYNTSHFEQELAEYIGNDICELNNRTALLSGKELDIYIPSKKIGIEFNGTYWHSSIKKPKNYHLEKSKLAEEAGIRLIHIWEYEWEDPDMQQKIKLMLDIALGRVKNKIYARNCTVRQITNAEAKPLNNKIHLQGHRDAKITYGLFYQNELVQLMSFSPTKYNKNNNIDNSWEIIRGCPGSNSLVVGGVSKLFKHFVNDIQPAQVFSYCDFNKFNGRSYEALGMEFVGYTGPDMKWVLANGSVKNRSPKKHKELKEQSVAQIFGAGSKKYLWKNEEQV